MKVRESRLYATILAIVAFFTSVFFLKRYTKGDQEHYREFYSQCFYDGAASWYEFFCYQNTLGSTEPVYFYLVKFFHDILEKDTLISLVNSLLVYFICILIFKYYKKNWTRFVFIFFVFTNYYIVVLLLAAERLKFAFLFLAISLLLINTKRIVFTITSVLTHTQIALLVAPIYIMGILKNDMKLWKKIVISIVLLALSTIIFIVMRDHILSKFMAYRLEDDDSGTGFIGVLKTSIFIVLAFISTKKFQVFAAGLPIVALSYFLGADRLGMLAFILYTATVIYYKGKADTILWIVMLYFSYKSISFILNVLNYGTGFHS